MGKREDGFEDELTLFGAKAVERCLDDASRLRDGAIKLLRELENRTIPWHCDPDRAMGRVFFMGVWLERSSCGTVGCIGGWCQELGGLNLERAEDVLNSSPKFCALCHPNYPWHDIDGEMAARVLRRWLETGEVTWKQEASR